MQQEKEKQMRTLWSTLTSEVSRRRVRDLLSTLAGLASLTLYKQSGPGGLEYAALSTAAFLYVLSCPGTVLHFPGHRPWMTVIPRREPLAWTVCLLVSAQIGLVLSLLALENLSLGDQRALALLSTVASPLVSYYALDSELDPRQILLLPASFVGVVLLCRPMDIFWGGSSVTYAGQLLGVVLALSSALCHSVARTALRATKERAPASLVLSLPFALGWGCATVVGGGPPPGCCRGVLLGGCGALGALSLLLPRDRHPRGRTSGCQAVLHVLEVVLAYGLQCGLFRIVPHWTNIVGAALVALCALGSVLCGTVRRSSSRVGSQFSVVPSRKTSTSTQQDREWASGAMGLKKTRIQIQDQDIAGLAV